VSAGVHLTASPDSGIVRFDVRHAPNVPLHAELGATLERARGDYGLHGSPARAALLGLAAAGALGFAAGFIVARDPRVLRRVAGAIAAGAERVSVAVAESREELADLWAEVRDEARADAEVRAFADAEGPAAGAEAAEAVHEPHESGSASGKTTTRRSPAGKRARSAKAKSAERR